MRMWNRSMFHRSASGKSGRSYSLLGFFGLSLAFISLFTASGFLLPVTAAHADSGPLLISPASGTPGTRITLSGSGYLPGEQVEPFWNYAGKAIAEKSFYLFNPIVKADSNGNASSAFFAPSAIYGQYTVAFVGTKSNVVNTATFQLTPRLDIGIYQGSAGSTLRIGGWGFGLKELVNVYWNWTPTSNGTFIAHATTNGSGAFSNRTYRMSTKTPNGTYIVAATGTVTHATAFASFTIPASNFGGVITPSDWPNFGYDLQQTRYNPAESIISQANVASLAVKWSQASSPFYKIEASPVVAGGKVYIGTLQGSIMALDEATGSVLWSFSANGPIYGSPTIQNGVAYFGTVTYPGEGTIGNYAYALNAQTGSLLWANPLPNGGEWTPPLVSGGRVFFTSAGKEGISGGIIAFDVVTGATLWNIATKYGIWSPDASDLSGQNIYVGTGNPCFSEGNPQPGDNCSGRIMELDSTTGTIKWSYQFPDISGDDDVATAPVYVNGTLYVGCKNGNMYAFDATSGSLLWTYSTGESGDNGIYSSPAYYNGEIYFGSGDSYVHALDASTGNLLWKTKTGSLVTSSPSIANDILYIGGLDGKVYAMNPVTGSTLWSFSGKGPFWGSPSISSGVVYESGGDGYIYAFSPGGI